MIQLKKKIAGIIPDRMYLKHKYKKRFGFECNLKQPQRFTEKMNWLKLYDKNPIYVQFADKYRMKEYISTLIGSEYIIPTLGIWSHFDEIDFDKLPDSFVLKCTHDSGSCIVVKDKHNFDKSGAKKKLETALARDFSVTGREWPYKYVERRILAEQYIEDSVDQELRDYKFFGFNGVVPFMFIASNRLKQGKTYFDFFDTEFNHLPITKNGSHENAEVCPHKPEHFDKMLELSRRLSEGFPFLRVDFYEADGKVYVGELTLYHYGGMVPFEPDEWDYTFGKYLHLPDRRKRN